MVAALFLRPAQIEIRCRDPRVPRRKLRGQALKRMYRVLVPLRVVFPHRGVVKRFRIREAAGIEHRLTSHRHERKQNENTAQFHAYSTRVSDGCSTTDRPIE